jgi:uncharacterized protein YndB with AHSA1/START domain
MELCRVLFKLYERMITDFQSKYQTVINASPDKVWEALTNPLIVKQYFFNSDLVTDWVVGEAIFWRGNFDGKSYEDKGKVLEYEHNAHLSYSYLSSWSGKPDLEENYLRVSYQVEALAEGTRLTITQSNYSEEHRAHSEENWAQVVEGLKGILES